MLDVAALGELLIDFTCQSLDDAREQLLWGLGQADVVKISDEEDEFLFGLPPEEGAGLSTTRFGGITSVWSYDQIAERMARS